MTYVSFEPSVFLCLNFYVEKGMGYTGFLFSGGSDGEALAGSVGGELRSILALSGSYA